MQFFVRSGALHAITHMRSNDIILGSPYDIFFFTMLQEMMAVALEVHFRGILSYSRFTALI